MSDDTLSGGGLGSSDIAPGAITAADVAGESLTGDEVADESLTVSDITDESLTGAVVANDSLNGKDISELSGDDVNDNTLTGADIANTASGADNVNADRVDGRHVCRGEVSAGSSFTTICASGALTIEASCTPISSTSASGVARLRTSQSSNAFYVINGSSNSTEANFTAGDGPATLVSLSGGPAGAVSPTITRFHASSETGQLTGSIAARVFAFSSSTASCEFTMDILG